MHLYQKIFYFIFAFFYWSVVVGLWSKRRKKFSHKSKNWSIWFLLVIILSKLPISIKNWEFTKYMMHMCYSFCFFHVCCIEGVGRARQVPRARSLWPLATFCSAQAFLAEAHFLRRTTSRWRAAWSTPSHFLLIAMWVSLTRSSSLPPCWSWVGSWYEVFYVTDYDVNLVIRVDAIRYKRSSKDGPTGMPSTHWMSPSDFSKRELKSHFLNF